MLELLTLAVSLLWTLCYATVRCAVDVPIAAISCLLHIAAARPARTPAGSKGVCVFYEGVVDHVRKQPVHHAFRYNIRMAVVDLDDSPPWFDGQSQGHLTAKAARQLAGTSGKVELLTHPKSAGYAQNPISVYYCHGTCGTLEQCIAEVTNTPWGKRSVFVFDPNGETVAKSLHVSPFQDMTSSWTLKAPQRGPKLYVSVHVRHPVMGDFFSAVLSAKRSGNAAINERSGFQNLLRYGYEPHRVAVWIYWQAFQLWRKGVEFFPLPA